jgi:phospholipid/cholesterol/gamma-HCH transport system permease protein
MFLDSQLQGGVLTLQTSGRWLIENLSSIEAELATIEATPARSLVVDTTGLEELDLSGAWALFERLRRLEQRGLKVSWRGRTPDQIRIIEQRLTGDGRAVMTVEEGLDLTEPVRSLGRWAVTQFESAAASLAFIGRIFAVLGGVFTSLKRLRLPALVRQVLETGVQAIPIVSLIAFLISVIIAYMGATELRRFGAEIFVVDLVTIGVLRELGVLLTAIIIAGRSGSAFAAEIGVMKLNEEIDALHAIGTNPVEVLVTPRVLGLVIALPLLTVIADGVGLTGGGLLCFYLLDIPPVQYIARVQQAIAPTTFWVGIIKAPVFAFLIAYIGTLRGMQVRESSRELGRLTTVAVVQSIFLVILADALFAVLFLELDI